MEAPHRHEAGNVSPLGQLKINWHAAGIAGQPECVGADGLALQYLRCPLQVLVSASGATGDDSLIHMELTIFHLV